MKLSDWLKIHVRYAFYLLWEFRWPLGVFWTLVLGGGLVLVNTSTGQGMGYAKACYGIFLLIFLESALEFPPEWYLQPFFFLLPIIGLGAVADSLVRLAFLTFTKKNNLPEWQRMAASLHRDHVVIVGIGKVGYQILKGILALREPVVAVERPNADSNLIDELLDLGVPLIRGDGRTIKSLEQAGVRHAKAVILATSDDLTNLDAGLTARDLNPGARIVLRLFDESLAIKVKGAFAMPAISTAKVSAHAFIAAATGRRVYQEFQLADEQVHLTDLTVSPMGKLVGVTVGSLQAGNKVNVVMHRGPNGVDVNPSHWVTLEAGDEILVIARIERLIELECLNDNRSTRPAIATEPAPKP
ncbi:potassium channel family protein [Singulisphaera sp. PoT]|uniref:potassium channel family protein n=1 Tax=Singulisphaera sp. PoT TaxID=3411797 RepID=UPI003BF4F8BF